jgi:hypothetical protein
MEWFAGRGSMARNQTLPLESPTEHQAHRLRLWDVPPGGEDERPSVPPDTAASSMVDTELADSVICP